MLYRKQTMAVPTKNSAEEAESPTMCVVVTEWLQIVVFPSTSGTWLNLAAIQDGRFKSSFIVTVFLFSIYPVSPAKNDSNRTKPLLRFSPKWVVKVGVESFIPAIGTEERYDVPPWVSSTASKNKYGRELFWTDKREREIREMVETDARKSCSALGK